MKYLVKEKPEAVYDMLKENLSELTHNGILGFNSVGIDFWGAYNYSIPVHNLTENESWGRIDVKPHQPWRYLLSRTRGPTNVSIDDAVFDALRPEVRVALHNSLFPGNNLLAVDFNPEFRKSSSE